MFVELDFEITSSERRFHLKYFLSNFQVLSFDSPLLFLPLKYTQSASRLVIQQEYFLYTCAWYLGYVIVILRLGFNSGRPHFINTIHIFRIGSIWRQVFSLYWWILRGFVNILGWLCVNILTLLLAWVYAYGLITELTAIEFRAGNRAPLTCWYLD